MIFVNNWNTIENISGTVFAYSYSDKRKQTHKHTDNMKHISKIILVVAIGSLNALAVWNTCIDLTGNFGKNKQQTENEIKKFEIKLNSETCSLTVK